MAKSIGIVDLGSTTSATSNTTGSNTTDSTSLSHSGSRFATVRRKFGGKTLLEWIVRRVSEAQKLSQIVVLVENLEQFDICARIAPANVPIYVGGDRDALGRCAAALREFDASSMVRIDINTPFVDPVMIDRLVQTAEGQPHCDYVGYCRNGGMSLVQSQLGVGAEWCRASALCDADQRATQAADRQDPTRFIVSHPEIYQIRLVPLPTHMDRSDLRLSLHSEEDWDHAHQIVDALGIDGLDWKRITNLLDRNPKIRERMAALNGVNE